MAEQNNPVEHETVEEQVEAAAVEGGSQEELEQLRGELAEAREQALRMAADAQNQRRRAEREIENAHKFALEKFAGALLSVADNLERAIDAAVDEDPAVKALREGVELTHKGLLDVFASFGVEQVDPHGEPFNPDLHQAISMVENAEVDANTVLAVMQKGYTLNGRLLRAAMVMVSRGGSSGGSVDTQA